jgi:hypothetical protein
MVTSTDMIYLPGEKELTAGEPTTDMLAAAHGQLD